MEQSWFPLLINEITLQLWGTFSGPWDAGQRGTGCIFFLKNNTLKKKTQKALPLQAAPRSQEGTVTSSCTNQLAQCWSWAHVALGTHSPQSEANRGAAAERWATPDRRPGSSVWCQDGHKKAEGREAWATEHRDSGLSQLISTQGDWRPGSV